MMGLLYLCLLHDRNNQPAEFVWFFCDFVSKLIIKWYLNIKRGTLDNPPSPLQEGKLHSLVLQRLWLHRKGPNGNNWKYATWLNHRTIVLVLLQEFVILSPSLCFGKRQNPVKNFFLSPLYHKAGPRLTRFSRWSDIRVIKSPKTCQLMTKQVWEDLTWENRRKLSLG